MAYLIMPIMPMFWKV